MRRTAWPLLNRARLHGMFFHSRDEVDRIDVRKFVPVNVQYAWDTAPPANPGESAEERNLRVFSGSSFRSPFSGVWFEWQEPIAECKIADDPYPELKSDADCFALLAELDDDSFAVGVGWTGVKDRQLLRNYPVQTFATMRCSYSAFQNTGEEYKEAMRFPTQLSKIMVDEIGDDTKHSYQFQMEVLSAVNTIMWSLLLLSCNNVDTIETQPNERCKKRQRDPLRVIHKELNVQVPPGGTRKRSVSEGDEVAGTAFHVRRGHFADYTQGKGLFGKYHGKYWIPATTVGDAEYGTVLKSYRLEGAPSNSVN